MGHTSQAILGDAIQNIFGELSPKLEHSSLKSKKKNRKAPPKQQLELALTVLLVDVAACDDGIDPREQEVITKGLMRMFGTGQSQVNRLITQAKNTLKNLRGISRFAELLKSELSLEERENILEIIEDVINADGEVDGFETYFKHKIAKLLDVLTDSK